MVLALWVIVGGVLAAVQLTARAANVPVPETALLLQAMQELGRLVL